MSTVKRQIGQINLDTGRSPGQINKHVDCSDADVARNCVVLRSAALDKRVPVLSLPNLYGPDEEHSTVSAICRCAAETAEKGGPRRASLCVIKEDVRLCRLIADEIYWTFQFIVSRPTPSTKFMGKESIRLMLERKNAFGK